MGRRSKYNAVKVKEDGYTFDSKAEHRRYSELKLLLAANEIYDLEIHPRFPLEVNGTKVCDYIGDFQYTMHSARIVEDVKGIKTAVYQLKKKMMLAQYGIRIYETGNRLPFSDDADDEREPNEAYE